MNSSDHCRLVYASKQAFINGSCCCDAQRMVIQTPFAKKVTRPQDCDHRFLALLGNDGELDLALLDVKNRIRDLSLRKNNLILSIFGYRFPLVHVGEKYFGIKRGFNSLSHKGFPFSQGQRRCITSLELCAAWLPPLSEAPVTAHHPSFQLRSCSGRSCWKG